MGASGKPGSVQTAYRSAAFDQDPVDVAFLSLWACINEILPLRYAVSSDGDFEVLDADQTPVTYWSPREGTEPRIRAQVYERRHRMLEPDRNGEQCLETQHAEILFELAGDRRSQNWDHSPRSRWDRFLRCRILRNELALEHGDVDSRRTATVDDLRTLVTLWQWMLFV